MKIKLIFLFLLIPIITFSQRVDTIIKTDAYSSYFSYDMKNPLMVVYTLYRGGGDCDRNQFCFNTGNLSKSAKSKDYFHTGYDKGHMANAEDFAYDCRLDSMTFKYWNCVPQTPQLNRGIWRVNEEYVRNISHSDSLLVLCGNFYNSVFIGDGVYVPERCWKVVYSIKKKKVLMSYIFTNNITPIMSVVDIEILKSLLLRKYSIDLNTFLK